MINSFSDKTTAAIFDRKFLRRFPPDIQERAHAKRSQIDAATIIEDFRVPFLITMNRSKARGDGLWKSVRVLLQHWLKRWVKFPMPKEVITF